MTPPVVFSNQLCLRGFDVCVWFGVLCFFFAVFPVCSPVTFFSKSIDSGCLVIQFEEYLSVALSAFLYNYHAYSQILLTSLTSCIYEVKCTFKSIIDTFCSEN